MMMVRGIERLPEGMRDSIRLWVEQGQPYPSLLGSFMRAVLVHDLVEAFACADEHNTHAMRSWALWLYNDAPGGSHGSWEKLVSWHEHGGLSGILKAAV